MANYNVGNIEIGVVSNSDKVISSLDKTIAKLQEFKKIDKNLQNVFLRINQLANGLKRLEKINISVLNYQIDGITNSTKKLVEELSKIDQPTFGDTAKSLNQLGNAFRQFDKLKDFDFRAMYQSFNSLNRILTPFLQKLKDSEASLVAMASVLNNLKAKTITKAKNEIAKADEEARKFKKTVSGINFSKLFNIGKLYFLFNYTKRITSAFGKMISSAVDFNETLNKFQVSMGGYQSEIYKQSLQFIDDITKSFNLSTESIMNYMSTFKNMLSAFGNIGAEDTYGLSETLTRMALDYASLFNVEVDRAMEQFQSVLSGQIRTIRTVSGYDVSEASIYNVYKSLGGTKTMRQLDQMEKRLLRIIALQEQMEKTGAVGDFDKTINTTANQLKQLSETMKEIGRWIGQLTMFFIEPFIEKVLGFAIAVREILETINISLGYAYEEFKGGDLFGETEKEAENTLEAVENLKNSLLGFDEINVLGSTESSTTNTDYDILISKIKDYQDKVTDVENKANEIAETILEWFGFTRDVNGELEKTGNRLDIILGSVASIIGFLTTSAIFSKVSSLVSTLTALGGGSGALATIGTKLGVIGVIVSAVTVLFVQLYNSNEEFKNSINSTFSSLKENLAPQIESIKETFMKIYDSAKPFIDWLWNTALPIIGNIIADTIVLAIEEIVSIVDVLANALGFVWELVKGLGLAFETIFGVITLGIEALITGDGTKVEEFAINMVERFKEVGNNILEFFTGLAKGIGNLFINAFNWIIDAINRLQFDLPEWLADLTGSKTFGFNIPKIPMLANGGVIDKPTVAMMGEYAGANTNKEIVTPENLMREVFVESMLPIAQMIASGNNDVVSAIENMANRPIHLNGRKVSENIYDDMNKVAIRKTGRALSYAR